MQIMKDIARCSGYVMAHAVLSVSTGETLISIYGYIDENDQFIMQRMPQEKIEDGVEEAKRLMDVNPHKAQGAVYIFDGRIPVEGIENKKIDALIAEFKLYGDDNKSWVLALPYMPASEFKPLGLYKLQIFQIPEGTQDNEIENIFEAFCDGIDAHEEGSKIWNKSKIILPANEDSGIYENAVTTETYESWQHMYPDAENFSGLPEKYDDASWHSGGEYPEDLPESAAATHIGMFFAWCYFKGLVDEQGHLELDLKKLKSRKMPPGQWAMKFIDGAITNELLNDEGIAFARNYYSSNSSLESDYYGDLDSYASSILTDEQTIYHLPDNWESYDGLSQILDQRLKELKGNIS